MKMFDRRYASLVWSAAPTPLTPEGIIDFVSVERLSEHHAKLGVKAVFIGGTCGEGPFLSRGTLRELAKATVKANASRQIATMLQITDNSAERMIENLTMYADTGIDMAVIAPPFFQLNPDQDYLYELYLKVIEASPVPIGIYHRGKSASVVLSPETVARLLEHPKVLAVKDSACSPDDTKVLVEAGNKLRNRKDCFIYCGNEFDCVGAAQNGYDGMMIGGACFNARMARDVFQLAKQGAMEEAKALQARLNDMMYECFGGRNISCWLAGEKQLMVELGVFSSNTCIINYKLTPECAKAIKALCKREAEYLS